MVIFEAQFKSLPYSGSAFARPYRITLGSANEKHTKNTANYAEKSVIAFNCGAFARFGSAVEVGH